MFIIMGGTGHIGSAVANSLLDGGNAVTIVVHKYSDKARALESRGAKVAVADVHDSDALNAVFKSGKRLFMLNPPANPSLDVEEEELTTIDAMLSALSNSQLEFIVAQSTYGARPIKRAGDLSTLYTLEKGLKAQTIPFQIVRAAYLMTNWDEPIKIAQNTGRLPTILPQDLVLPMVDPKDVGAVAARLLTSIDAPTGQLYSVEGPERYCALDVVDALQKALPGRTFECDVTPRDKWFEAFQSQGFSKLAAESFVRMNELTVDEPAKSDPEGCIKGTTSLYKYIANNCSDSVMRTTHALQ